MQKTQDAQVTRNNGGQLEGMSAFVGYAVGRLPLITITNLIGELRKARSKDRVLELCTRLSSTCAQEKARLDEVVEMGWFAIQRASSELDAMCGNPDGIDWLYEQFAQQRDSYQAWAAQLKCELELFISEAQQAMENAQRRFGARQKTGAVRV